MASEKIDALELDINAKLTTENLDKLITALGRLSKALDKVNAKKVNQDIKQTGDVSKEAAAKANILTNSFVNQAIKITALITVYRKLADVISDGVAESMSYVENLNLFTVSLGEYSQSASKYADTVRDALGIDYSEWERTQGIFNTLIEGFGVTGDKAAYMSQNLTQLTYDIASFYNLSFSEAEKKLQSAVAGELEPVRRIGYDLSQAKLTAIAQNPEYYGRTTYAINEETGALIGNTEALGENIDRQIANFNELTQAEKVQLRYIALMTQVTEAQNDLGRSLNDPANQMRVFKEQLTMTSRALGNVFIPMLNQVLPYLTAFFNVLEDGLQRIAAWFGYEIPDMSDRMDVSDAEPYYENIVEATGKAAKNAKKIKDYTIGLDELNVIRPDDNTGTGGSGSIPNYGNLATDLITPGYDFLTSAIENRVKEAKATIEQFGQYLSQNPIGVIFTVIWEGFGTIGEGFWSWVLGKTPEEFALEADRNGNTLGQQFIVSFSSAIQNSAFGLGSEAIVEWLLGKSETELAEDAQKSGRTVGEEFYVAFFKALGGGLALGGTGSTTKSVIDIILADEDLNNRASESGRTVGTQWALEFYNAIMKVVNSSEFTKAWYKINTGRDAEADYEEAQFLLNATKQRQNISNTLNSKIPDPTLGNSAAEEARRRGVAANEARKTAEAQAQAAAKAYADGLKKNQEKIEEVSTDIYNVAWNGVTRNGDGIVGFYNASSDMAKRYNDGLKTGVSVAKNAGKQLYNSAYSGASNNGYGGNAFSSLADGFARLFSNALGSNSALSGSYNSGYKLANEGTWGAYDLNSEFEYVGDMAGQGYILGIEKNEYKAERAGGTVANATLYRMKEVLGIASPSKEGYEMGMYLDLGFANAIRDFTSKATDASEDMARMSVLAMRTSSSMFNSGVSIPSNSHVGYGMGFANEGAMASLASNIYQAVVSGMSAVAATDNNRDIKVIIDGKEVFKVVQKEQRDRGVAISNGAFSR